MKRVIILSFLCVVGLTLSLTGKTIIKVTNDDALVDASTFIARLTNIPERKLSLEEEVKGYITGPLANEFLLAAYGRMKGLEKNEVAENLKSLGCSSTQSDEQFEMSKQFGLKYPITCKSLARDHVLRRIEKGIAQTVDAQVKKLSQAELDQFYRIRNKEQWREGWLNDGEITRENEMDTVRIIGLKSYEEGIATNILKAREKNKLVQEAKKHFEVWFDPSLAQVLADEIKESREKSK
jgi:hypothetical protein